MEVVGVESLPVAENSMLIQQVREGGIKPEALRLIVVVHLDFMSKVHIRLCKPRRATGIGGANARKPTSEKAVIGLPW